MPDAALQATERQFMRLLRQAAGDIRIDFHCFSLPSVSEVADRAMARRRALHRHRRSRPAADRRTDRHRRRAERRDASRGAVLAGPHRDRSTGRKPTPARRSGRVLPPTPRCCISTASSGSGSIQNVPASTTAPRSTDNWLTKDVPSPLKVCAFAPQRTARRRPGGPGLSIADRIRREAGVDIFAKELRQPIHLLPGPSGI